MYVHIYIYSFPSYSNNMYLIIYLILLIFIYLYIYPSFIYRSIDQSFLIFLYPIIFIFTNAYYLTHISLSNKVRYIIRQNQTILNLSIYLSIYLSISFLSYPTVSVHTYRLHYIFFSLCYSLSSNLSLSFSFFLSLSLCRSLSLSLSLSLSFSTYWLSF